MRARDRPRSPCIDVGEPAPTAYRPGCPRRGRKKAALLYCALYIASCVTKHWGDWYVLMLGRFFGGIATSLLFSVFESWLVAEHFSVRQPNASLLNGAGFLLPVIEHDPAPSLGTASPDIRSAPFGCSEAHESFPQAPPNPNHHTTSL